MTASNTDVARVFDEIADLLEIQGENAFRIRAYRNAARLIEGLGVSVGEMIEKREDLTELPGIGKDLAAKIGEIVESGTCAAREELRGKLPSTIITLLRIPGLGPKRVQTLYRELDISTPEQLHAAIADGKVRELHGFGEKTETILRQALGQQGETGQRFKLAAAAQYAEPLRAYLAKTPGAKDVVIAGSYRRGKETVGDLDIVVTAKHSDAVMQRFCEYPEVGRIVSKGETRSTVVLASGLQVDLRVVPQSSFGAALYYFTGSKAHNVATRRIAQKRGLKINEYGVFRGERRVAGETEQSVFRSIGLPFIAPELRENRGEIEAALTGSLPKLITAEDLQGDLRVAASGDAGELEELISAARRRGLHYLGVTPAARSATDDELPRWHEAIDRKNGRLRGFVLLKGIEVDIRENGELDKPATTLGAFDFVVGAVNSQFNLPRAKQTTRLLRAIEHAPLTMLAHPAGRLIGRRPELDADIAAVVRAARERGCVLELNSQPERLDLPDVYCRLAHEEGALVAINSGAASAAELANLGFGIGQARRGWLEAKDVLNTRPIKELRALLARPPVDPV